MSQRILAATRKGLFTLERAGGKWAIAGTDFLGDDVGLAFADPRDGTRYAALHHGHFGTKLHRSRAGQAWQEIAVPAYPPMPEGEEEKDMWGKSLEWKLRKIWALEPGHASQPGVVWAGTAPGGLFRSEDGGDSWTLVRPLWDHPLRKKWFPGGTEYVALHSVCVHPADPNHITVGVSCGGVWQTTDGGATWDCRAKGMRAEYMPPEQAGEGHIQDPHRVVQCPARPECYWAQHHNGVFRTTDGAANWTEVTNVPPSVFGFAVAVHPRDPETAWFVPAIKDERRIPVGGQLVVTRTRDGGKSFDVLRAGLPQEHAYDIVFRHALDIDASGERLAFGSTTGGLWVSEDQGDSWAAVAQRLPPIYSVRFAK